MVVDFFRQFGVAFRLLGLPPKRRHLRIEAGHQIFQPGQIRFGLAQLALRIAAANVQSGNPGGFFQHLAAFGRFGGNDLGDLALADQRR